MTMASGRAADGRETIDGDLGQRLVRAAGRERVRLAVRLATGEVRLDGEERAWRLALLALWTVMALERCSCAVRGPPQLARREWPVARQVTLMPCGDQSMQAGSKHQAEQAVAASAQQRR